MSIAATEDGTFITIYPEGALDQDLAESLRMSAEQALLGGKSRFIFNLHKVPFAHSAGLEVIVRLARKIADADGRLALVGATAVLIDILKATRLDRRLAVFDSTEAALQSMKVEF